MECFLTISGVLDQAVWPGYIDPGTGSLIIQMLIGGLAAGLIAIKIFWGKIRAKLFHTHSQPKDTESIKAKSVDE